MPIHPDTDQAVVGSVRPGEISVVDLNTEQILAAIQAGKKPFGLAIDTARNLALVTQKPGHRLSVISLTNYQTLASIADKSFIPPKI